MIDFMSFICYQAYVGSAPEKEKQAIERLIEPLATLANSYEGGREGHACNVVKSLFKTYLDVEEPFNENQEVCFMLIYVVDAMVFLRNQSYSFPIHLIINSTCYRRMLLKLCG